MNYIEKAKKLDAFEESRVQPLVKEYCTLTFETLIRKWISVLDELGIDRKKPLDGLMDSLVRPWSLDSSFRSPIREQFEPLSPEYWRAIDQILVPPSIHYFWECGGIEEMVKIVQKLLAEED